MLVGWNAGHKMKALLKFAAALVLIPILFAGITFAQALGDVARENRNESRPRAKKVYTNDEIPSVDTLHSKADVKTNKAGGDEAATTPEDKAAAKDADKDKVPTGDKTAGDSKKVASPSPAELAAIDEERKKQQEELADKVARQREKVSLLEREMKVTEREHRQSEIAHYTDVNARLNSGEKWSESQKQFQDERSERQEQLTVEREKLAGIEEQANRAGVKLDQAPPKQAPIE